MRYLDRENFRKSNVWIEFRGVMAKESDYKDYITRRTIERRLELAPPRFRPQPLQ